MTDNQVHRITTISEYHKTLGLPMPEHPLISVIDYSKVNYATMGQNVNLVMGFYSIAMKKNVGLKMRYGQTSYDFDEGLMVFLSPGQLLRIEIDPTVTTNQTGYLLTIHPDFLWKYPLAKTIRQYEYFGYAVNEALFLSEKEEATLAHIFENIQQEYKGNLDKFSHDLIIAQIELLLKYADRFYNRQFLTRRIPANQLLTKVENYLRDYFADDALLEHGLPSVQQVADAVFVSPNYLSTLLKSLVGKNTQTLIHEKVIEKAKEQLSTTNLTVSEIAFALGFEHSQSFSKLFKSKTGSSPLTFRQSFH